MSDKMEIALRLYIRAKAFVTDADTCWEIGWQRSLSFQEFAETDLLRETAWVILCSGFKEAIVRKYFDWLSLCFCDWESAREIVENANVCRSTATTMFRNVRKIDAIVDVARRVDDVGHDALKKAICSDPIRELQKFSLIGPITSWHLAKNLGLNVAKPDRHLNRLSLSLGFDDAHRLCEALAAATGEKVNVVDIVLWRYVASNFGTCVSGVGAD